MRAFARVENKVLRAFVDRNRRLEFDILLKGLKSHFVEID